MYIKDNCLGAVHILRVHQRKKRGLLFTVDYGAKEGG